MLRISGRLAGLLVFCCGAVTADAATPPAGAPRLQVNGETVVGAPSPTPGIDAYLGLPFAEPPVGGLRWRAPVEFVGRGVTRTATTFAPACMQSMRILDWYRGMAERFGAERSVFPDLAVSEDCLHLNVWAPRQRGEGPLPVMVFIHGGSNRSGWSYEPNYHGHRLAAEGAVVVTIAYRLGVFGFFSHPQLADERGAQANFGLWDQLAALRWVRRHIAAFGGDPDRVTLFGESAGGGDIAALMLSPAARGLMHRAIIQSGGDFGWPGIRTLAAEQARGLELARAIDAAHPPDLAALRRIDAERLLEVGERVFSKHYHAPVIDGVVVNAQLQERLAAGGWPLQQLMIGTNANEYYSADQRGAGAAAVDAAVAAAEVLKTPEVRAALGSTTDAADAIDRLATADSMLCPAQLLATEIARAQRPVWMYHFTRVREGRVAAELRAYHGAELPYVFGTHDAWLPTSADDERLTREMMRAWVRFAASGSPDPSGAPHVAGAEPTWWPYGTAVLRRVMRFDAEPMPVESPEKELCGIYRQRVVASASQN
jgi:para-nitrobenzyl esterase